MTVGQFDLNFQEEISQLKNKPRNWQKSAFLKTRIGTIFWTVQHARLPPRLLGIPAASALFGDVIIAISDATRSILDWLMRNMLTKFLRKVLELINTATTNAFPTTPVEKKWVNQTHRTKKLNLFKVQNC